MEFQRQIFSMGRSILSFSSHFGGDWGTARRFRSQHLVLMPSSIHRHACSLTHRQHLFGTSKISPLLKWLKFSTTLFI